MRRSLNIFDQALARDCWPSEPAAERRFPIEDDGLIAAAKLLALLAYPLPSEQASGGPAHRFTLALLAYAFRLARWNKSITAIPKAMAEIKPETMQNTINKGSRRLDYRFKTIHLLLAALVRAEQNRVSRDGRSSTFCMTMSGDLSKMNLEFSVMEDPGSGRYRIVGTKPTHAPASLRATILNHLQAFTIMRKDSDKAINGPEEMYANVYKRHIKPIFGLFHVALFVNEAWIARQKEASDRKLVPVEVLMFQCDWADRAYRGLSEREGNAIHFLRAVGVPICSCRLLKVVPEAPSSF